jgi:DNA recombination protein RmuC
MTTEFILLVAISVITLIAVLILFSKKNQVIPDSRLDIILSNQDKTDRLIREGIDVNKQFASNIESNIRKEIESRFANQIDQLKNEFKEFNFFLKQRFDDLKSNQGDRFQEIEKRQKELIDSTEKRLDEMKVTVEEKLQKTLQERIGQSFEQVGRQLESVQQGLGEMKTLAQDVGGLKKVLSNVKMRGGIGEVQLSLLLEQLLAPDQYQANVKTKKGSNDLVEFAIKLPGKDEEGTVVYLPIDAKFPKEYYEHLQEAYDLADVDKIAEAQKQLENAIKRMAKDIRDKYLDPPNTTDFGIMFLPFEGIYAEVVRKAAFLEEIQREYKVIITGPATLAAILNSLQMGFKTLAIQKSSSKVWTVLGAVKKEFETFGGLLGSAQNNIQKGLNDLDDLIGKRTRMINSKLKNVQVLDSAATKEIFPELPDESLGKE